MAKRTKAASRCTVCIHPDRFLIEAEVVAGISRRAIAAKHGLGLRAPLSALRPRCCRKHWAASSTPRC
jgi:hypothetical protein